MGFRSDDYGRFKGFKAFVDFYYPCDSGCCCESGDCDMDVVLGEDGLCELVKDSSMQGRKKEDNYPFLPIEILTDEMKGMSPPKKRGKGNGKGKGKGKGKKRGKGKGKRKTKQ